MIYKYLRAGNFLPEAKYILQTVRLTIDFLYSQVKANSLFPFLCSMKIFGSYPASKLLLSQRDSPGEKYNIFNLI